MNVSLTKELDAFVQAKVKSGAYGSASEVVRAGLRQLRDGAAGSPEALRAKLLEGYEQIRRGEVVDGRATFDEILRRGTPTRPKRQRNTAAAAPAVRQGARAR